MFKPLHSRDPLAGSSRREFIKRIAALGITAGSLIKLSEIDPAVAGVLQVPNFQGGVF